MDGANRSTERGGDGAVRSFGSVVAEHETPGPFPWDLPLPETPVRRDARVAEVTGLIVDVGTHNIGSPLNSCFRASRRQIKEDGGCGFARHSASKVLCSIPIAARTSAPRAIDSPRV